MNTHDRIIEAAKALFEEKGFAAATTKEIADLAQVSEVTLFRHFESKRKLFEKAAQICIPPDGMGQYFQFEVTYDLERDLKKIAYKIMETYKKNAPIFQMIMRDKIRNSAPEIDYKRHEHNSEQKLQEYFETMKEMEKINTDPQMATKFFVSNVMAYLMREILKKQQSDDAYFEWMLQKVISIIKS